MNRHIILTSIMFAVVACLIMAPAVMAQQFEPPTPESMVERIEAGVKLSADQRAKILQIYSDMLDGGMGRGMRGGMFGGINEDIAAVLTPEQVKQLTAYNLKQSVDRRLTQIDEAVSLTDDQRKKVIAVIEKEITTQNAMMAVMRAEGENADFMSMRDKMAEFREATAEALGSILTEEQMTKYENMPRRGMRRQ